MSSPSTSKASWLYFTSTFGFDSRRFCMALEARRNSFRTRTVTFEPYFVRKRASSAAESPPPMTTRCLLRKMGTAPSQTAQAETPFCQYLSSPARFSRFAFAPVARMTTSAVWAGASLSLSSYSRQSLNGRLFRSSFVIVSVMILVPKRSD